jgi:hypothetical protein
MKYFQVIGNNASTRTALVAGCSWLAVVGLPFAAAATENAPQRPFAVWADVPAKGQLVAGFVYEESESYHIWAGGQQHSVKWQPADGESYGIDINQGFFSLQYGINERWAADFSMGYTSIGWRYFDNGEVQTTDGLMDYTLGVRYQLFNETNTQSCWVPTLTFRAGAVMPGSFDETFIYAPGTRSAAIQPELLARKHFGWPGFGAYGDAWYRWNKTIGNAQYSVAVGFFQQYKGWEVDLGYQHMQTIFGNDVVWLGDPSTYNPNVIYPRDPREIRDTLQAGFSYTTSKRKWRYGFHLYSVVDGNNSDNKLWLGGSIDIPFTIVKDKSVEAGK